MSRAASLLWSVALCVVICVLSQGFLPVGRFLGDADTLDPAAGASDPCANVLQGFVLLVLVAGTAVHIRAIAPSLRAGLLQWPVWLYCAASTLWSCSPGTTLRRSALLLAYFLFGHVAVTVMGTRRAVTLMSVSSAVMIGASLLLFVAVPGIGQDVGSYEGALRGVFSQKNITAWAFQLALAYLGYGLYADRRVGVGLVLGVPVIIIAIVLTRSTTELLACFLLIAFWIWSAWFRSTRLKLLPLWAAAAALAGFACVLLALGDDAYRLIGKDSTLTGRGPIWEAVERAIAARPLLGHGFQGFWQPQLREVQEIWAEVDWQAPHAHNGLLELLVEDGYVGLALYGLLACNLVRLVVRGLARDSAEAWWTLSWMILVVFKAHAEPVYLQLDMSTALISFSTVVLGMQERAFRAGQAPVSAAATAPRIGLGWNLSS